MGAAANTGGRPTDRGAGLGNRNKEKRQHRKAMQPWTEPQRLHRRRAANKTHRVQTADKSRENPEHVTTGLSRLATYSPRQTVGTGKTLASAHLGEEQEK